MMYELIVKLTGLKKLMKDVLKATKVLELNQRHVARKINKFNKNMEAFEIELAQLKENSHPPIFKKKWYDETQEKIEVMWAFFENIEQIQEDVENKVAN